MHIKVCMYRYVYNHNNIMIRCMAAMCLQLGAFNGLPKLKHINLGLNHITSLQNGESTDSRLDLIRVRYVSYGFDI